MKRPAFILAITVTLGCFSASMLRAREPEPAQTAPTSMPGPKVGEKAPDAQIALLSGTPVQLKDMYAKGPIVLVFYRGGWCPYCNKALSGWDEKLSTMASMGATVVALTPENPEHIKKTMTDQHLRYGILSDYKNEAATAFGIVFEMPAEMQEKYRNFGVDLSEHNWDKTWRLPHPAAYVIDRDGTIRYAYCNEDYKVRADPAEVIAVLKTMVDERNAAQKK